MPLTKADRVVKLRSIRDINTINTPLIVPGFSSVICSSLNETYVRLHDQLTYASLISAYDLSYRSISLNEVWGPQIVFVDSGCWEVDFLTRNKQKPRNWSVEMYEKQVRKLSKEKRSPVVVTSYDKHGGLKRQKDSAIALFEKYEGLISDFLIKPPSRKLMVDTDEICKNIDSLNSFHILGFAEKELGDSILERCKSIAKIRNSLNSANGMDKPIHIFGCSDPIGILAYFLCGADIFDGISWLKYGFHESSALYINNYGFLKSMWTKGERGIRDMAYISNLNDLAQLMSDMQYFAQSYAIQDLKVPETKFKLLQQLVGQAGVQI